MKAKLISIMSYNYHTGEYTFEVNLATFSAENYLLQSFLLEKTGDLIISSNLEGFQDTTYHIPFILAASTSIKFKTTTESAKVSNYLNQLDSLRNTSFATNYDVQYSLAKTSQENVTGKLQDALNVTYEERKTLIENNQDLNWHEKWTAHVDNWLNEGSKGMRTVSNALDVADKAIDVVTKTGMFPVLGDAAHGITQSVKNAAREIADVMSADSNTLAMYRWSKSTRSKQSNEIKENLKVNLAGKEDLKLKNDTSENKKLDSQSKKDITSVAGDLKTNLTEKEDLKLKDDTAANKTLASVDSKTEKEYKGFINDIVGNIILQMDAFTHVYLSYLFTISEDKDGKNKTEVLYKGLLSENNNLYPYFFYMDEINFKPAKNQTVDLTYGAYKTKVQMQKPEGKNTFSFVVANDISLTLYRSVKDSSLGASDRGLAFATVQNTLASGVPINLAVIISSGVFKEDSKNCVRVQKFVLEDIKFSSINELPFSHKDGQSKSKIEGIYKRCLWYPNYKVGELA